MAYTGTEYGDISPRTGGYAAKELLKRSIPLITIEKFAQAKPLSAKSTKTMIFRRYNALDPAPNPLTEGVTPSGKKLTKTDVSVNLVQYGDFVELTDIIQDHHEDPVLMETMGILGEQAAQMLETVRYGVIKAGTGVTYANGSARTDVNTVITTDLQRRVTRALKRQNARQFTSVIRSTAAYGTVNVAPSYIGLCHTDCESDIRAMTGFKPVEDYGSMGTVYEGEIGKVEDVRYVASTVFTPWADGGGAKGLMISTTGTNADVYPVIYLARDAFATIPFKGKNAVSPLVLNPNVPRGGDPLGQRGSAGWKASHAAVILQDAWMHRLEVAVKL
jgi:N4-gp56 family major capsid protein